MFNKRKKRAPEPKLTADPEPSEDEQKRRRREMQQLAEQDAVRGTYEKRDA